MLYFLRSAVQLKVLHAFYELYEKDKAASRTNRLEMIDVSITDAGRSGRSDIGQVAAASSEAAAREFPPPPTPVMLRRNGAVGGGGITRQTPSSVTSSVSSKHSRNSITELQPFDEWASNFANQQFMAVGKPAAAVSSGYRFDDCHDRIRCILDARKVVTINDMLLACDITNEEEIRAFVSKTGFQLTKPAGKLIHILAECLRSDAPVKRVMESFGVSQASGSEFIDFFKPIFNAAEKNP